MESENKRGLATACAAADTDLGARREGQGDGGEGCLGGVGTGVVNNGLKRAKGGLTCRSL